MKISEIYEKYNIPPNLQEHQLRVTAVAKIIADNHQRKIDKESIMAASLLHDMGNIIKFKLELFPEFLEPEGLDYWQNIKDGFIKKYGSDEHEASAEIAKELKVSLEVQALIEALGFDKAADIHNSSIVEEKICGYSDMRVKPHGVTVLRERLTDARKRYVESKNAKWDSALFDKMAEHWEKVEQQVFENSNISPEDINDEKVKPAIQELKKFEIITD